VAGGGRTRAKRKRRSLAGATRWHGSGVVCGCNRATVKLPRAPLTPVTLIKYIVAGTQTPTVYLELYRCRGAP